MAEPEPAERPPARPPRAFIYLLGIAVALVIGYQLGQLGGGHSHATGPGAAGAHTHGASMVAPGAEVGGLSLSAGGFTLVPETSTLSAGTPTELRFRVLGPGGTPLTSYATVDERQLHLIVARRDLSGYQHLHPALGADGAWTVPLTLPEPGVWRAIADFAAQAGNGQSVAVALGVDLIVTGEFRPHPVPAAGREATVGGLTVTYEGTPRVGATVPVVLRAYQAGNPVRLEPYLGSSGHLVLLRDGDLAYLHVHPDQASANEARFWLTLPSPGRYRMFFDFQVGGAARTAGFTVEAR
jgi:hypothetical protein